MRSLLLLPPLLVLSACPAPPVDYEPVRIAVLGDQGEGNDAQFEVGLVLRDVCAAQGCDFALLLGDNFYDVGVTGVDDVQWQDKFELPYAEVDLDFYAVLGNHDYGGTSNLERAGHQIAYTDFSEKWMMPDHFYAHSHSNVDLVALDTSPPMYPISLASIGDRQAPWLDDQFAGFEPDDRWRIVYGHHPYLSNGHHGDAGAYDGLPDTITISGAPVGAMLQEQVCGVADLYLAGHDHDRQWLEPTCDGTQLMISGAGSKLRPFEGAQPVHWSDDQTTGFAWLEIDDETITVQFWDRDGSMAFEGGWTR